jgi:hypothetical protein
MHPDDHRLAGTRCFRSPRPASRLFDTTTAHGVNGITKACRDKLAAATRGNDVQPNQERPGRELMQVDDVVGNLPFIVRRDQRIVAAFARKAAAEEWAQMRSWNDESRFTVHTAAEVLFVFQDGEEAK